MSTAWVWKCYFSSFSCQTNVCRYSTNPSQATVKAPLSLNSSLQQQILAVHKGHLSIYKILYRHKVTTCTPTHPTSTEINQSVSRATEIHIMWLLSYSALIKVIPVTSQRRGETAVSAEGQEEEENYSLIFCVGECVSMCAHLTVIKLLHDTCPLWLTVNNDNKRTQSQKHRNTFSSPNSYLISLPSLLS